jgi:hypothetical protein
MNWQVIKNRIRKTFVYTFTGLLFLLVSAFLLLQIPPVQSALINFFLKDFSQVVGFQTHVDHLRMTWFDNLELRGVTVYDSDQNPMIDVKKLKVNFTLDHLFGNRNINIDGIVVDSAHVYLTKLGEGDDRNFNINVFIAQINKNFSKGGGGGNPPKINIGEAIINQSQFSLVNQDQDSLTDRFDHNHFSIAIDEGQLRSFAVIGDTIEFDLKSLILEDLATNFKVDQMSTFFRISQKAMEFYGLDLKAGQSHIKDTIQFNYESQLDLNDFNHLVRIYARLDNTVIHPNDLATFAPGVERIGKPVVLNGFVNGRVDKFRYTNMDITLGNSHLVGTLEMEGLPDIQETFINTNLANSYVHPEDISFLFREATMQHIRPMGLLSMQGQFIGYPSDFVANGIFNGKLGSIRSDINFKVNENDIDGSEYSGRLTLKNFDLGHYLQDTTLFQKVNLDGQVKGAGLTLEKADFTLNGNVNSLGIKGYNYTNIKTNARFAAGLFSGLVNIDDPNLEFMALGTIDLRDNKNEISIRAEVDTAYLHRLNLSKDSVFLHANIKADITGLVLDSLQGVIDLNDINVHFQDREFSLDNIHLVANRNDKERDLRLTSTLVDARMNGSFYYSDFTRDVKTLLHEIRLNIANDRKTIATYYQEKNDRPKNYEALIHLNIKDIEPIASIFNIDLSLSKNTPIDGKFTSGYTTIFSAYSTFDTLIYNDKKFYNAEVEITTSKIADSTNVLSMATIQSERQTLTKNLKTKNLLAELIWNNNHINFGLDADQQDQSNYIRLQGVVDFLKDSTVISMMPSELKLLERDWTFAKNNFLSIRNKEWRFQNVVLQNQKQAVKLEGQLSEDPSKIISLVLGQVDLSIINALTEQTLTGTVDAQIDINNFYGARGIQNNITITDLTIDKFLVGDITGKNIWDTVQNKFDINIFIDREKQRIIDLKGDYKPSRTASPLIVNAFLDKANLKILEPFLGGIFKETEGTVSGNFSITGKLIAPEIRGTGIVQDGQIMVDYTKTVYRFTGEIGLTPNAIVFKDILINDILRNRGNLNGSIKHQNFRQMELNIVADFRNLQVLNTSSKDNDLFYGQAYATGDLSIRGPVENLIIQSTAKSEKNTRIYIPLSGTSTVEKKDFITFINFRDSTNTTSNSVELTNKVDIKGLTIDFNIDVTPDAYCEIIFDALSGDIIRGRGNGDLKLNLNTKGEFNMFGPFEFTEGWYNFTLYDIVNKEFAIRKGSRITWYGDPYQANVNIDATYNQLASLSPLITDATVSNSPQLQRKYPVLVSLALEGPMMAPSITFDIVASDLPKNIQLEDGRVVNLDLEFTAFKNKLDEQELNKQVFSLIVLRRLSPLNAGIDASGSLFNSVSELLSNQLSYWMSQVDEDLVIDVDLGSMDEEKFNTFQLRLSYTFLNGRLRVTGDGTFNNNTNTPTGGQSNPSTVAGDWTVDYMLTPDGKLRVKMYSRTNVNPLLSSVNTNQNAITTGASLIHTQSFNKLKDLWEFARERKRETPTNNTTPYNEEAIREEELTP